MSITIKKVLVTGGTGFVGKRLITTLAENSELNIFVPVRRLINYFSDLQNVHVFQCESLELLDSLDGDLLAVDIIIHCAAKVHIIDSTASDSLAEFRLVNTWHTLNLARNASLKKVKRFIYLSSIKVNGEYTTKGEPYRITSKPAPIDPYGISKMEAEQGLRSIAKETAMEVVIIRPVLVYGEGVKANFFNMMCWLYKGIPLPLGAIENKRSFVSLPNLVSLIVMCMSHPKAANQTFLVSDEEDLSTTELLHRMGLALGYPARLLPIPQRLLVILAKVFGKEAISQRLCGSLQVDISHTRDLLGWTPTTSLDEALAETANYFLEQKK